MHDVTIGQISFTKRLGVTIEEVKIGAPVSPKDGNNHSVSEFNR